jgi:transposase-like protein
MKRSKFPEEQLAYALRQAESGTPVGSVRRQLGVSEATLCAWKKTYGHLGATEPRRHASYQSIGVTGSECYTEECRRGITRAAGLSESDAWIGVEWLRPP